MKRKRLTSIMGMVMAVMMCISLLPTTALAAENDFVIENGVLMEYKGNGGHVVIPDSVTSIADEAFLTEQGSEAGLIIGITPENGAKSGGKDITSLVIPDSVTSIGVKSFYACENMQSITIGNSVTSIGDNAFESCFSLESVIIPDSVKSIGDNAFFRCKSITSATIGNGVTSIGKNAFGECGNLTSLTIGNGVIGDSAFYYCRNLTNLTIENGVTSIGDNAFLDCAKLTDVKIPDSVTSISDSAFHILLGGMDVTINPNLVIHANSGSYAETYAKENNIPFVSAGGTTTPTTPTDTTTPTTPPTTDKPSAWAETQVNTAIAANIVPTALQGQYTQATTRAEFCALAVALYENVKGTEITERTTFNDTTDINVQKAAAIGVVSGVGNNNFAPNDTLTREQAATMLSRLAAAIGKPLTEQAATFADNNSISQWAFSAVGQVQASGVMGGVGNNTFAPQEQYTREQSIITMNRLFEIVK